MMITGRSGLDIWTIYERPKDYPGGFIARLFVNDTPTEQVIKSPTLEHLREVFSLEGLTCIARSQGDDPVIVECWL